MPTVVLIGTDHKFQKPLYAPHRAGIKSFRITIRNLCKQYKLKAIAEEMSLLVLQKDSLQESVAEQVYTELGGLPHNYSDPDKNERPSLGIRDDNCIQIEGWKNSWSNEKIEHEIRLNNSIREKEWLRRVLELNQWPLLFICGADHFNHFAILLRESGINVIETFQDWEPTIEVKKPTTMYSIDSYPCHAKFCDCLSEVSRKKTRQLLPSEKVSVSESVCGKDFWALKIIVSDGSEGWILDTDEGINITYPSMEDHLRN